MADLFHCGFDFFTSQAHLFQIWNGLSANATVSSAGGRRGGGAANCASTTAVIDHILPSTYATLIAGVAFSPGVTPASAVAFMFFGDTGLSNSLVQVTLAVDTNNAIRAYRGTTIGTLLGTSANNAIAPGGYQYVEAKVFISATVGTVDVHVNGVSVLSLSSLNTKNTANTTMSHIALNGISSSSNLYDDFYVCDTSGSVNNDFLGDQRIDTSYPIADGHYQQWTPTGGGAHYTQVNAVPPQIANNVSDSTIGNKDTYNVTALTVITGTIAAVQETVYADKSDAGARSIQILVRSSSTDSAGSAQALSTSTNFYRGMYETDPNGSITWTETSFNAADFGEETA